MFENLSDTKLEENLKTLVQREREILVEVLRALSEVQRRRLYLKRAFSSMFDYCVRGLGYSEHEAQARISAMRLMDAIPQAEGKIERGEISLSVASQTHWAFQRAQKQGIDVDHEAIVESLTHLSARAAEKVLAKHVPQALPRENVHAVTEDTARVGLNLPTHVLERLEKLKGLLAAKDLAEVVDKISQQAIEKLDLAARAPEQEPKTKAKSRHLSPNVRRFVWKRAGSCCEFVDPQSGQRCGSAYALQVDHILEFARGGGNDVANLRLLCGAHNRYRCSG